jgi:single-strand DNA-binding protein
MANYNKVILVGNLTRDPQMSYLPSQTPVVEFGIAVNRKWKGPDNQPREETCFVDCRIFGKQAETFAQYMSKGKSALIEGRLQIDTWEGKDGAKHSKHRIFVERFQFMGGPGGPGGAGGAGNRPQQARPAYQQPQQQQQPQAAAEQYAEPAPPQDIDEPPPSGEDIPF